MIEIRVHHLFDFARALVDLRFREREYLALTEKGGQSYTSHKSQKLRELFESLTDTTPLKIILGLDYICEGCNDYSEERKECAFPDSLWDCKELFGKIIPVEVVKVEHLKSQYQLWKKLDRLDDCHGYKKQIIAAHHQYRRENPLLPFDSISTP